MNKAVFSLLLSFGIKASQTPFDNQHTQAKHLVQRMSRDEKIGQLFMIAAIASTDLNEQYLRNNPNAHPDNVKELIEKYHVGGIIFQGKGRVEDQKKATNYFQKVSKIPLLIGQDLEWGLSMRLIDMTRFPRAMTLGALQDNNIIYQIAHAIGLQARAIGVHMNFAPVVDINTNSANPVIGDRSFGQDKEQVFQKAYHYMRGLHDAGVLSCAKHFPGHGDTHLDSHYALPAIMHCKERLEEIELYPFKEMIKAGVPAIMIAHLLVPSFDTTVTSLSGEVNKILRNTMQFNGLIITDGLDMKAVADHYEPGHLELQALLAGNDILLCPNNVEKAVQLIRQALDEGAISENELDAHVVRIVQAKLWSHQQATKSCSYDINQFLQLKKSAYSKAITLLNNNDNLVPQLINKHVYVCSNAPVESFIDELGSYISFTEINVEKVSEIIKDKNNVVIFTLNNMTKFKQEQFGLNQISVERINDCLMNYSSQALVVIFGSPYSMELFKPCTTMIAYENDEDAQRASAKIICGSQSAQGTLPINNPQSLN